MSRTTNSCRSGNISICDSRGRSKDGSVPATMQLAQRVPSHHRRQHVSLHHGSGCSLSSRPANKGQTEHANNCRRPRLPDDVTPRRQREAAQHMSFPDTRPLDAITTTKSPTPQRDPETPSQLSTRFASPLSSVHNTGWSPLLAVLRRIEPCM